MKKEENVMSVGRRMFLSREIDGLIWIIAGVFGYFENILCTIICVIAMVISTLLTITVIRVEKEDNDEMALQHLQEAKAITQERMYRIIAIIAIVFLFTTRISTECGVNWKMLLVPLFYIILGMNDLSIGFTFRKLEEE